MKILGTFLTLAAYIAYAALWIRLAWHIIIWCRTSAPLNKNILFNGKVTTGILAMTAIDVFFFRRLFETNKLLWAGEWIFHLSFLLVIMKHLRYFITPAPHWIHFFQPAGTVAGYILPVSLFYIFIIRVFSGREKYFSPYNFFLIAVIFLISLTGVMMQAFYRPDIVNIKEFVSGILTFSPAAMPDSFLFILHFVSALFLAFFLPAHIIAAPIVMIAANKRETELDKVMP